MDLSIVVPLFNERDNLTPLHAELARTLAELGRAYELLFVDDGSDDGSLEVLRATRDRPPRSPAGLPARAVRWS
jgi:glycosyltransferase involved in cell wall biosynthesis